MTPEPTTAHTAGTADRARPAPVCVFAHLHAPGLGDLLQRNVLCALVGRAYPGAAVTLVVGEEVARRFGAVLRAHATAAEIMTCPEAGEGDPRWPRFLDALRARNFACCLIDPGSLRLTAEHARTAGIPERVGLAGTREGTAVTRAVRPAASLRGRSDLLDVAVAVAAALGLPRPGVSQVLPVLPHSPAAPGALPEGPGPCVVVHPGGAPHWNRRWPQASYLGLLRKLAAHPARLLLVGDRSERGELERLRGDLLAAEPHARVRTVPGHDLDHVAGLVAAADLLVGNDSALGHVAAAVRTPSVVIYGPTGTEFLWTRLYPHHRGVSLRWRCQAQRHDVGELHERRCAHGCEPAYRGPDGPYPRCLTDLPVAAVWSAVHGQLTATHPAGPAPAPPTPPTTSLGRS